METTRIIVYRRYIGFRGLGFGNDTSHYSRLRRVRQYPLLRESLEGVTVAGYEQVARLWG